ncbi:cytochrome P450 [Vallicoccus soli]|uniref:Cytochrome P450 n=1 Tax=Vallicoccus soli TaxID=2339232 RepID=A0A3A3Z612_9ACTN|nr:cytochrome P450 [Vallicoccus soli]RJK97148.1 cytochrome P450 [Vallicoccus soli]
MGTRPRTAPGPEGLDMLRAVPRTRADAPGFLLEVQRRWGDVVQFPVPRPTTFLVSHPDGVRRVLQDGHKAYDKATVQYRTLSAVSGRGLLTSDGELWRRQRRLAQPAFHDRTLVAVAERTGAAARRQLERWAGVRDGAVVDVDAAMMHTTLDVVGGTFFGADLTGAGGAGGGAGTAQGLVDAVLAALEVVVARARTPLPARVPLPGDRRLARALATIDGTLAGVVAARRARGPRPAGADPDLLDLLLAATDGDGPMDDRQLRDELVTALVAGHETVASALTWTWHLLSRDPAAARWLHEELDAVLGPDEVPGHEHVPALVRTRAVLDEALRLFPPAWVVTRRALQDDVVGGYAVPAGSLVIVSPWVVHRHPGAWADPERFDPARFLPERRGTVVRGAYLPFGAGPRLCIGRGAALVEGTLLLAALARRVGLEAVRARVGVDALVTLRPRDGLPLRLRRRA